VTEHYVEMKQDENSTPQAEQELPVFRKVISSTRNTREACVTV